MIMAYTIFYISIIIVWIVFLTSIPFRPLRLSNFIIGITSVAYSLVYEITFGDRLKLYYYINPENSILYMLIAGIFIYPLLNIIYTLFLPFKMKSILIYTFIWIVIMLIFEYINLISKTIVFTGWKPIPWSIVTYIVTYTWVLFFYKYLSKRTPPEVIFKW
jgi:hypothetical protein